ncbi:MAG: IS1634 family transposase [Actinomycetota bacterium]|nr:IS1634 family transposase [Actinomycetota bacterium]
MAKRTGGAMHVATTTRRYKDKTYHTHLLRRSVREGSKVRKETLANLSHLPGEAVEAIRRVLTGESLVAAEEAFSIRRSRPHGHVAAVWAQAKALGLAGLLGPACVERDVALALVVARVCRPGSKLATTRWWTDTTLAPDLGVEAVGTDATYAAMDWLADRQAAVEEQLAARHLTAGGLVLFDLSGSYVEGRHNELAAIGYSRDGKRGKAQITYGLVTDRDGRPVAVEVFAGNTADPTSFTAAVTKIRDRFGLPDVVMVGDRGMITQARIDDLKDLPGAGWITALRAPAIKKLAGQGAIQLSLFDQVDLAEITHPDYPGERLVACRNPALAAERARKRGELLAATDAELDKVAAAVAARRLVDAGKIGVRVGRVLNRFKMAKHYELTIDDAAFSYQHKHDAIDAEAALDGVYVVRTSVTGARLAAGEVVEAYKRLRLVEAQFRSLKTVDLHLRPIHHRLAGRVRAHVFICMLAAYLTWHLRQAWAPLCFTDEDPPDRRDDPVGKAERSPAATTKASTGHTTEGHTAHSFQSLLDHLATLTRNEVVFAETDLVIDKLAEPTDTQRRAFDLIQTPVPTRLT